MLVLSDVFWWILLWVYWFPFCTGAFWMIQNETNDAIRKMPYLNLEVHFLDWFWIIYFSHQPHLFDQHGVTFSLASTFWEFGYSLKLTFYDYQLWSEEHGATWRWSCSLLLKDSCGILVWNMSLIYLGNQRICPNYFIFHKKYNFFCLLHCVLKACSWSMIINNVRIPTNLWVHICDKLNNVCMKSLWKWVNEWVWDDCNLVLSFLLQKLLFMFLSLRWGES